MIHTADDHAGRFTLLPVLSLFPGAGLLDRGFAEAGFWVLRGPDTLLGQDVRGYHIKPGVVTGIIGGPPCQDFSRARRRPPTGHGLSMLREFGRLVTEGEPEWFLIENVPGIPDVHIPGYTVQRFNLFASEFGLRQWRNRSFQFGSKSGRQISVQRGSQSQFGRKLQKAVMASEAGGNFADKCELQGLPRTFDLPGLSRTAKARAVGNGVPVVMARAVAEAILVALDSHLFKHTSALDSHHLRLCACGCGRVLRGVRRQQTATPACRKRMQRKRLGQTRILEL